MKWQAVSGELGAKRLRFPYGLDPPKSETGVSRRVGRFSSSRWGMWSRQPAVG